ncbi:MAG: hypothetical protein Rpha_2149 [Candidatus Ruthia sp. Apha_13_S6]|nr:hypothetical protein [Candidatus Ruthia sp. Apha_13_S6]
MVLNGRDHGIRVLNNSIITLKNTRVNTDGTAGRDANGCKATVCG